jgi:hypothetical protein
VLTAARQSVRRGGLRGVDERERFAVGRQREIGHCAAQICHRGAHAAVRGYGGDVLVAVAQREGVDRLPVGRPGESRALQSPGMSAVRGESRHPALARVDQPNVGIVAIPVLVDRVGDNRDPATIGRPVTIGVDQQAGRQLPVDLTIGRDEPEIVVVALARAGRDVGDPAPIRRPARCPARLIERIGPRRAQILDLAADRDGEEIERGAVVLDVGERLAIGRDGGRPRLPVSLDQLALFPAIARDEPDILPALVVAPHDGQPAPIRHPGGPDPGHRTLREGPVLPALHVVTAQ